MKKFKITYRNQDGTLGTMTVSDIDSVCAQMTVIIKTYCDQIVRVVELD